MEIWNVNIRVYAAIAFLEEMMLSLVTFLVLRKNQQYMEKVRKTKEKFCNPKKRARRSHIPSLGRKHFSQNLLLTATTFCLTKLIFHCLICINNFTWISSQFWYFLLSFNHIWNMQVMDYISRFESSIP